MDSLAGSVERVTYYHPDSGYSVLRLRPEGGRVPGVDHEGLVTVTGNLPELTPGEYLHLQGRWLHHPKHGLQFQVEVCEQALPVTVAGIRRYLGSGLVKGIGAHLADRIVSCFGKATLEVIENTPERLQEVPEIGPKRAERIARAWQAQKQVREIMLFLHSYGISTNLAVKIYKQYGESALSVVRHDPYRLAQDIWGIGFKTADKIARALGLPEDHPSRIEAGLMYVLNQALEDGHVFLPRQELVKGSVELLGVAPELAISALEHLCQDGRLHVDILPSPVTETALEQGLEPDAQLGLEGSPPLGLLAVYLSPIYSSETSVAERLHALSHTIPSRLSDLPPAFVRLDAALSPEQQAAIRMALSHPVTVLTGGPGTGKTTALKALVSILEEAGKTYALASPTGRAAKRLSQATGHPASTVHRLLGYVPGEGFKVHAENPLSVDLLVVDEASMLDLLLANHLLRALRPGTHLLLVGDVDQLPSVGAGDVLRDVIASGIVPTTRLTLIFRQAEHSHIVTNAHLINQGKMPVFPSPGEADHTDFYLFHAETPEQAADWVLDIVCKRIPMKFGLHPRDDVQVLAPMYRGSAGVLQLNERLQASLNPPDKDKPERQLFGQLFRRGDKVMQVQNNYDKDVYNGDIGFIFAIGENEHTLVVDFEGRAVIYDWSEADQLVLAYAVSVHKSQGCEFPAVVLPLVTQHYMMLQRNLLYTAITRARELCVLVGNRRAIGMAVRKNKVAHRFSGLRWRLREGYSPATGRRA